jgi:hypothetical protein
MQAYDTIGDEKLRENKPSGLNCGEMETTVSLLPSVKDLRDRIRFPLGLVVSPTRMDVDDYVDVPHTELIRCSKCGGFLSPNSPVEGNKWSCIFCRQKNVFIGSDIFRFQSNRASISVILNKTTEIGLIYVLYLSRDFNEALLVAAKVFAISILRNLPSDAKVLFCFGGAEISLFGPSSEGIVRFSHARDLCDLELSNFFLDRENAARAEIFMETLGPATDSNPHGRSIDLVLGLSTIFKNCPIRFISIVRQIAKQRVDLEHLRQCIVRLDFVVAEISPQMERLASELPGSLLLLSARSPSLQAKHFLLQDTKFQLIFKFNSVKCEAEFSNFPHPFSDASDDTIFLPVVPTGNFPIALELEPEFPLTVAIFQFVSKFIFMQGNQRLFVMRISNFSIRASTSIEEYVNAVNWNNTLWFWLRRVADRDPGSGIAAVQRVVASLMREIGEEALKVPLAAACALDVVNLFGSRKDKRYVAMDLLFYSSPSELKVLPVVHERCDGGNVICESVNGVHEDRNVGECGPSKEAMELQMRLPVYRPVSGVIPAGFLGVSEEKLEVIRGMMKK